MENLKIIKNLDLENKLTSNYKISSLLGIDYFDEKLFLEIIDKEVKNITSRYNLKAGDDYNKLANFLLSIKYSMQSSDDSIATLENLYQFFKGHANKKSKEEYITIYNKKIYKIDILKNLINIYSDHIRNKDSKEDDIIKRCSK